MPNLYFRKTRVKCLAHGHKSILCVKSYPWDASSRFELRVGSSPTIAIWFHSVMVRTMDCLSINSGPTPGETVSNVS